MQELWHGCRLLIYCELPQHSADADEDQVSDCDHDGQFDNQHRDAEKNAEDTEGYARGSQNQGDAHGQYKNSQ